MMTNGIDSSLQGYRGAEASLDARAARIAKAGQPTRPQAPAPVQGQAQAPTVAAKQAPDFTTDMANLTSDRLAGSYNLKAMKVQNRMLGDLLDILK